MTHDRPDAHPDPNRCRKFTRCAAAPGERIPEHQRHVHGLRRVRGHLGHGTRRRPCRARAWASRSGRPARSVHAAASAAGGRDRLLRRRGPQRLPTRADLQNVGTRSPPAARATNRRGSRRCTLGRFFTLGSEAKESTDEELMAVLDWGSPLIQRIYARFVGAPDRCQPIVDASHRFFYNGPHPPDRCQPIVDASH
jgi:hypothetical protein